MRKFSGFFWNKFILFLLYLQLFYSLIMLSWYLIFESDFKFWLGKEISFSEKLQIIKMRNYYLVQEIKNLFGNSNFIINSFPQEIWFLNYHLLPQKLYFVGEFASEKDFPEIPEPWLKNRNVQYVIFYNPPVFKIRKIPEKIKNKKL